MEWISVKDRLPNEEQDVLLYVESIETYGMHGERKKYTITYIMDIMKAENGLQVIAMDASTFTR